MGRSRLPTICTKCCPRPPEVIGAPRVCQAKFCEPCKAESHTRPAWQQHEFGPLALSSMCACFQFWKLVLQVFFVLEVKQTRFFFVIQTACWRVFACVFEVSLYVFCVHPDRAFLYCPWLAVSSFSDRVRFFLTFSFSPEFSFQKFQSTPSKVLTMSLSRTHPMRLAQRVCASASIGWAGST